MSYTDDILADGPDYWCRFDTSAKPENHVGTNPSTAAYGNTATPLVSGPIDSAVRIVSSAFTDQQVHLTYGNTNEVLSATTGANYDYVVGPKFTTFECWFQLVNSSGVVRIVTLMHALLGSDWFEVRLIVADGSYGFHLLFNPTGGGSGANTGYTMYTGSSVINANITDNGQWHHVVWVLRPLYNNPLKQLQKLYIDGVDNALNAPSTQIGWTGASPLPSTTANVIDQSSALTESGTLDIKIAELAMYENTNMSQARALAHYEHVLRVGTTQKARDHAGLGLGV